MPLRDRYQAGGPTSTLGSLICVTLIRIEMLSVAFGSISNGAEPPKRPVVRRPSGTVRDCFDKGERYMAPICCMKDIISK